MSSRTSNSGDDPLLYLQWYIDHSANPDADVDLNVRPVWDGGGGRTYTGAGVHVGIFDSRVDRNHPDLESNYDASLELDTLYYQSTGSGHGTSVAGIIAAARNGVGMTGIAYGAHITSMPVLYSNSVSMPDLGRALAHARDFDVINMSFGGNVPFDISYLRSYFTTFSLLYKDAADNGRAGLGTILVQAAGNNRMLFMDANLSSFQSQRYNLVVAAVDSHGMVSDYSSEGANVLVSAPSSGNYYGPGVATTDQVGTDGYNTGVNPDWDPVPLEYTTRFGGTSGAAPMITGIVALMLEANPDLGWRDVRDILAVTARHTGSAIDVEQTYLEKHFPWTINNADNINGAGLHFDNNYGFGLADALAAVRLAESWTKTRTSDNEVSRQASISGDRTIVEQYTGPSLDLDFTIEPGVVAQNVTLYLDMTHGLTRKLTVVLVSPSGTQSLLFSRYGEPRDIYGTGGTRWVPWTFNTNQFMGEDATGTWHLLISEYVSDFPSGGVFHSATLTVHGDPVSDDTDYIYTNEFGILEGMTFSRTIDDVTGTDTLNLSAVTAASVIDLRPGRVSTINGQAVTVTAGTVLENAWGGDGVDRISGNTVANRLEGMRGDDQINSREGDDTVNGGAGDDILNGGAGDDRIDGGDGIDKVSYIDATGGVVVNLNLARQVTAGSGTDYLYSIENVEGSNFNDRLGGTDAANVLWGRSGDDLIHGNAGNDTIHGGDGHDRLEGDAGKDQLTGEAGDDTLAAGAGDDLVFGNTGADAMDGGEGNDTVNYSASLAGITVDLTIYTIDGLQAASGGDAEGDRLYGFENVLGTRFNDLIWGDSGANRLIGQDGVDNLAGNEGHDALDGGAGNDVLNGGDGNDTVIGGAGGDRMFGGEGIDTLSYAAATDTVGVRLLINPATGMQSAAGGEARGDFIGGFENVIGGSAGDALHGDDGDNRLQGQAGDDVLYGNGGRDGLEGGNGNDRIYGGDGDDRISGGAGADTMNGNAGNDVFIYTASDVVTTGDAATMADLIQGFHVRLDPAVELDRIDLRGIDAIAGGSDDAFSFIGSAAFSAAGQIRVWFDGANTVIEANTIDDADGHVELEIILAGMNVVNTLSVLDFAL